MYCDKISTGFKATCGEMTQRRTQMYSCDDTTSISYLIKCGTMAKNCNYSKFRHIMQLML
jgi:hypothetical protein